MSKVMSSCAVVGALAAMSCFNVAPAWAFSVTTYVSGKGTDTGTCASPATPCRTFQFAFNQTFPGGEIKALDPADYSPVTINRSVSIVGVEGAGILRFTAGDIITINAGASGVVNLSNLTLEGFNKTATNGITLNSAGSLTIRNCTARNFSNNGINLKPTTALKFLIADAVAANNGNVGAVVFPQGAGTANGTLDHVAVEKNAVGVFTATPGGAVDVTAVDSVASDNSDAGFFLSVGTTLRLSRSTATRNSSGVNVSGTARSAGNNFINGNTTADVSGTLTNDGTL